MAAQASTKVTGVCKWFDTTKGYGFISVNNSNVDIFVHQSDIFAKGFRSLMAGESVEFEILTQRNGRRKAISVTGPNGTYVKGAEKPNKNNNNNNKNNKKNKNYNKRKETQDSFNIAVTNDGIPMTDDMVDELLCQGIKPWDDDAGAALAVLYDW